MTFVFDHPFLLFLAAVVVQWGAAYAGDVIRRRGAGPTEDKWEDFNLVRAATLTTLPETRVPSFSTNVSADAMAASDTTHRLIAVAMTILFI